MSIKLHVVSTGTGVCALTDKADSDGLTVAFENEAPCFVSWKAFKQLLSFKTAQGVKAEPKQAKAPEAVPVGNGVK